MNEGKSIHNIEQGTVTGNTSGPVQWTFHIERTLSGVTKRSRLPENSGDSVFASGHRQVGYVNFGDQGPVAANMGIRAQREEQLKVEAGWKDVQTQRNAAHRNQKLKPLEHLVEIDVKLDYYVDLEVEFRHQMKGGESRFIKLEDIFAPKYKIEANRILIQGDAGFGKTTVLQNLGA